MANIAVEDARKNIEFAISQGGTAILSEATPYETRIHATPANVDWTCEDTESGEAVKMGSFDYANIDDGAKKLAAAVNTIPAHYYNGDIPTPINPKKEKLTGITPVMVEGLPVYFEPHPDDYHFGGVDKTWKQMKDTWIELLKPMLTKKQGKLDKFERIEIGSLGWFSDRIGTRNLNAAHHMMLLDTMHALRLVKKK